MKRQVYVCGSKGFIGRNLVSFLNNKHNDIAVFSYDTRRADCGYIDYPTNSNASFVYAAYDRRGLLRNIFSIIDVIKFSKKNNISKLIFLSSISIFSTQSQGYIETNTPISKVWEDYVLIKRIQEAFLKLASIFNIIENVYILRAPVVLGKGCSWNNTINYMASHDCVALPKSGNGLCNYIYVEDLCGQITDCTFEQNSLRIKYITPSNGFVSWAEVIETAREYFYPKSQKINIITTNGNDYAEKTFKNKLYKLRYTILGYLLEKTIRIVVNVFKRNQKEQTPSVIVPFLARSEIYIPSGLIRASMSSQVKAKSTILSSEQVTISKIFAEMAN
jgi:nucleoside-diphosphate-sugar epimerase